MLGIAQQTVGDILAEKRQLALFSKNLPSESPSRLSATSLPKNANWRFSVKTFLAKNGHLADFCKNLPSERRCGNGNSADRRLCDSIMKVGGFPK
jgi:hypothetical protein